ncbi:MAG: hypothetical protein QY305_06390 [Candidatus Brocadiaceae baterium WH-1]|nr:MAG: hypothetical protein QY305_06390 [Candidatus Jettenia sp. AMX2]
MMIKLAMGFFGSMVLILVSKFLLAPLLQKKEDYYKPVENKETECKANFVIPSIQTKKHYQFVGRNS